MNLRDLKTLPGVARAMSECVPYAARMRSGIYTITHIASGKQYVGSAIDFAVRWKKHRSDLRLGRHHSVKLQRSWDKYGDDAFRFDVVELVEDRNFLVAREQFWLWRTDVCRVGYNSKKEARAGVGVVISEDGKARLRAALSARVITPETREKLRQAKRGWVCTPEVRAKISASNLGRKQPPDAARRSAASRVGRPVSVATRAKIGNANRGRVMSAETRAKMSAAARRRSPKAVAAKVRAMRAGLMVKRAPQ